MKKYLIKTLILSLVLAFPVMIFAAYDDVVMSGSAIITVGGVNLVVSGDANFDSITVDADSFSIDLSKGATLSVTSADRRSFTVSPSQYTQESSCSSDQSTLTVGNNIWDSTITVTVEPSSTACTVAGGGGGGGGGGGIFTGSTPAAMPAQPAEPTVAPAVPSPKAQPAAPALAVSPVFNRTLRLGTFLADVKRLQQLLNSDPDTQLASSGPGSPGNETSFFGALTRQAVRMFQAKYGIVSSGDEATTGYGLVGPKTRAKLAEVFSKAAPSPSPAGQITIKSLEVQINQLLEKLKTLQAELDAML